MTFRSRNEPDVARRGPVHTPRSASPHAEIAQRGWLARRWEDREDVLAGRRLRWGYGRGLEGSGGRRERGGTRVLVRERDKERERERERERKRAREGGRQREREREREERERERERASERASVRARENEVSSESVSSSE